MEIRKLKEDELDFAILPCVDSNFRKTLKQGMSLRKEFLRKMMRKGLSVLVVLEKEFGKTSAIEVGFVNTDERKTVEKFGIGFGLKINNKVIYNRMPSWDEVKKALKSVPSVDS
jgi:hypothetical protein